MYFPTVQNGNALDDYLIILENDFVQQGVEGIPDIFSHNYADGGKNFNDGLYRPLTPATFALEISILGKHTQSVSHFINVIGFALLLFFMALLLLELGASKEVVLVATLLFAIHPIHTEVVANIKGRDDLFSLLFGVLFGWYFIKGLKQFSVSNALLTGLFISLALFSKETSVTYFLLFPLLAYALPSVKLTTLVVRILPFGLITVLFFALRTWVIDNMLGVPDPGLHSLLSNPIAHAFDAGNTGEAIGTGFWLQAKYLGMMLIPYPLIHDYSYNLIPLTGLASIKGIAGVVVFLGGALLAGYYGLLKQKLWALALAFYMGSLFITSNLLVHIGALFAERFLFIPSFGLLIALALGWEKIPKSMAKAKWGVLAILLVIGSVVSWQRNTEWKDNLTLFGTDLAKGPESARIQYNYGTEIIKVARARNEGKNGPNWRKAEMGYLKALEIYPDYFDALNNIGTAYQSVNDYANAERHLKRLTEINAEYGKGWFNLGLVYHNWGKHQKCIDALKEYNALNSKKDGSWFLMAKSAGELQQFDKAKEYLEKAIALKPGEADFYQLLGTANAMLGDQVNAEKALKKALNIKPRHLDTRRNLAIFYLSNGMPQKAQKHLEESLKLFPDNPDFQNMLADAIRAQSE